VNAPLITTDYLKRSLTDAVQYDAALAEWSIEVVSNTARLIANRHDWTPETVPPAVQTVAGLAARRLYTNPDRFTRESSGDYSYGLDPSVTNADVFTETERGTLLTYRPARSTGGLKTIATTRSDADAPSGYVPDGTAYGFPWYADDAGTLGMGW
jgi:hypothetical protein